MPGAVLYLYMRNINSRYQFRCNHSSYSISVIVPTSMNDEFVNEKPSAATLICHPGEMESRAKKDPFKKLSSPDKYARQRIAFSSEKSGEWKAVGTFP